ncbi:MAG: peptidoglycan synthetase [Saprospirales bacterium]|nr:peptidoglycan synthetase [Saprospirales bacterium]
MRIHLIAIGGSAMHNIALALWENGHEVTGSDDEIYNPARDRLAARGLLPAETGWFPGRIHSGLDAVILGMHARADNPELQRAQELGIPVFSYPAFLYEHSRDKKRVVVAGSHGKTTTTSMILHFLRAAGRDFDYLVGAQLEGFETMVRLSKAPLMVLEGDEYFSSPLDPVPKIYHYRPHLVILTGVAWDHINVFPTFESYLEAFLHFLQTVEPGGQVWYDQRDPHLVKLIGEAPESVTCIPYEPFSTALKGDQYFVETPRGSVATPLIGQHNFANLHAAYQVCRHLGLSDEELMAAIPSFKGASKRLQVLADRPGFTAYLDFAHAPSKVHATVQAVKARHPDRKLIACLELHTFSSLNPAFLPEYGHTLDAADQAAVFFSPHTLEMKKLPPLQPEALKVHFQRTDLEVFTEAKALESWIKAQRLDNLVLLLMSSGNFGGVDIPRVAG